PRPVWAGAIYIAAVALPAVAGVTVALVLARQVSPGGGLGPTVGAWVLATGVAALAMVGTERAMGRLLPLAFLLRVSLAFPDGAPARLGIALRAGSPKRLLAGRPPDALHPADAAAAVLALAASLTTHDPATRGHSERVRAYSELIADELGMDE